MSYICQKCADATNDPYFFDKDGQQKCYCKRCAMIEGYTPKTNKKSKNLTDILNETASILTGDRATSYGDTRIACQEIADYWNTYLGYRIRSESKLTAKDIPMMMVLFKMVRENHRHKHDNLVDVIGYAAIANYIEEA